MYVKATKDSIFTVDTYIDQIADGATLVWGKATNIGVTGWNTFTFHNIFYLPPGYNLMVYWINNDGTYNNNGSAPSWRYTTKTLNNHVRAYQDNNPDFATLTNRLITKLRPNIQAYIIPTYPENSVALSTVHSPVRGQTTG